jgi:hypothetical protein
MSRRPVLAIALASACAVVSATQRPSLADLKTTAESSGYKSTSTYDDVVKFMKAVDEASPNVFYVTYGTTYEGRPMPMAVVGTGLKDGSPASVRATGKLRVHIQGNIHAGEVEGKESAQMLLRELAMGRHDDWLQSMVFLITPIFNADGNEKFALTNRQRQNGPINGMGTRPNAQGLNINRDFMKLDTPEARAFVKLWNDYDPHVGFDLHTSNGSFHGYYLTYSPPLNPNTSDAILRIMKDEWFPFVTKTIKAAHGWDTFYYGNASTGGRGGGRGRGSGAAGAATTDLPATPEAVQPPVPPPAAADAPAAPREWRTFEPVPRFHNNYVGLRNRFGLLSEAYAYATFEDRIKATNYFLDAALTFAHQNAARLKAATAAADAERLVGALEATSAKLKRGGMVEILMGEVEPETNPNNGAVMNRRKDVTHPEQMVDMMWFEPAATETVPAAYYVPADATRAIDLLKAHGIQLRPIRQPMRGLEQFSIDANTSAQNFEGHPMRHLEGKWAATDAAAPSGALEVSMTQPLARLAFYLIEPASDDGLVNWNVLDDRLGPDVKVYPILRKKQP